MSTQPTLKEKIKHAMRVDRAVRFVWRAGPGWALTGLALVVVQGVLPLIALYLMKLIVDGVSAAVVAPEPSQAFSRVALLVAAAGGTALFSAAMQAISTVVRETQTAQVTDYMYDILHRQSISMDLAYYENPRYFDTLHRAQQEGPYRPLRIVNGLMQLGQNSISLLAVVGLLFTFHWGVAVVLFLAAIPGVLVRIRYSRQMFHWQRKRTADERKARYYNWMLTGDTHAKEIRLFGLGRLFIERFSRLRAVLRHEKLSIERRRSLMDFGSQALATVVVFGALGYIAYRTVNAEISLGDMVMYFGAFQRGLEYLKQTLGALAALYENNMFLSNLYEFLDLKPAVKDPRLPAPFPAPMQKGVVFDRVCFSYPESGRRVLDGVSLKIAPGEVVALVGDNGAGKTTLIKLLGRLYDPDAGTIFIDGIDLRRFATADIRDQTSVIFQDFVKYHRTLQENIWFGDVKQAKDQQVIERAGGFAGLEKSVSRLSHGYGTQLGKRFESGEELSEGEWQKVALARAFFRNAQIIVMDEPTSSLDVKTEYDIFNRFRQLLQGRTTVLISHRLSSVRMADRIFLLSGGRVVESGSHEDLMTLDGRYARLFRKQASYYQ